MDFASHFISHLTHLIMPENAQHELESQTRRDCIDPVLEVQCWRVVPFIEGADSADWTHLAVTVYSTSFELPQAAGFLQPLEFPIHDPG